MSVNFHTRFQDRSVSHEINYIKKSNAVGKTKSIRLFFTNKMVRYYFVSTFHSIKREGEKKTFANNKLVNICKDILTVPLSYLHGPIPIIKH